MRIWRISRDFCPRFGVSGGGGVEFDKTIQFENSESLEEEKPKSNTNLARSLSPSNKPQTLSPSASGTVPFAPPPPHFALLRISRRFLIVGMQKFISEGEEKETRNHRGFGFGGKKKRT